MIDMTTWEQKSETTEFKSIAESYATVCSMWTKTPQIWQSIQVIRGHF